MGGREEGREREAGRQAGLLGEFPVMKMWECVRVFELRVSVRA